MLYFIFIERLKNDVQCQIELLYCAGSYTRVSPDFAFVLYQGLSEIRFIDLSIHESLFYTVNISCWFKNKLGSTTVVFF
jgi:hypothetical protein